MFEHLSEHSICFCIPKFCPWDNQSATASITLDLWRSVCHQETPARSETSENRMEPDPNCTKSGQSVHIFLRSNQILNENRV